MKKIVIGLIVILAGILLFCFNFGILPYEFKTFVFSWPTLLIALGFAFLFDNKRNDVFAGSILMIIGIFFLLTRIFPDEIKSGIFWPALIIVGGIAFILSSINKKHPKYVSDKTNIGSVTVSGNHTTSNDRGFVKREFIFSGNKEIISNPSFTGAEIKAVFSGVEIDFTQCQLASELKYVNITIESVFSGVTIYLPLDWNLQIRKTGVFGDFVDRRPSMPVVIDESKIVVLNISSVFGGGEIKYYE